MTAITRIYGSQIRTGPCSLEITLAGVRGQSLTTLGSHKDHDILQGLLHRPTRFVRRDMRSKVSERMCVPGCELGTYVSSPFWPAATGAGSAMGVMAAISPGYCERYQRNGNP
jgi:hypothetical protein